MLDTNNRVIKEITNRYDYIIIFKHSVYHIWHTIKYEALKLLEKVVPMCMTNYYP